MPPEVQNNIPQEQPTQTPAGPKHWTTIILVGLLAVVAAVALSYALLWLRGGLPWDFFNRASQKERSAENLLNALNNMGNKTSKEDQEQLRGSLSARQPSGESAEAIERQRARTLLQVLEDR